MEFQELVRKRRSIRSFRKTAISEETLRRVIECALAAPSAGNLQAYRIFVVKDAERRRALAAAALHQDFIAQAPVVLVFCAEPMRSAVKYGDRGEHLYSLQDATIAATFAMLAATEAGLGTVWVGAFRDEQVRAVLGVTKDFVPVAILPLGEPNETPPPRERLPWERMVVEL
ncbi:MAG: nitroreductase family protein [Acidobacteriota bacterium]